MSLNLKQFQEGIQSPTTKFTIKELREREDFWRALWSWIPDEVKRYTYMIGSQIRVIRRDYRGSTGLLADAKFSCTELSVDVVEKRYNENDGKYYFETKTVQIPWGAINFIEFLSEQVEVEGANKYEIEPIPESEGVA